MKVFVEHFLLPRKLLSNIFHPQENNQNCRTFSAKQKLDPVNIFRQKFSTFSVRNKLARPTFSIGNFPFFQTVILIEEVFKKFQSMKLLEKNPTIGKIQLIIPETVENFLSIFLVKSSIGRKNPWVGKIPWTFQESVEKFPSHFFKLTFKSRF